MKLGKKRKRLPSSRFESGSDDEGTVKQAKTLPPAPKIKGPNFDIQSSIKRPLRKPESHTKMTSPEPRMSVRSPEPSWSLASPEVEESETSIECIHSKSPEPSCVRSSEPQQENEGQRPGTSTLSGLVTLLHRVITNQEMKMDHLKFILMTMQKTGEPARGQDPFEREMLPLQDTTSLLALEKRLREEDDLKNKMIMALSVIGGLDIKDTVWRVMKHCFTNCLAKQPKWRGINGKTAFQRLELKNVTTATVRKNKLTAMATDQEVEIFI
ncbi:uncharacterized protein [Misgurnus anguillicaudatus]|uniref:uncharacterized protein n=1 Tax=Misgurnus anguillicaudatus TaxID=75329 RepID=UPI003CCF9A16